METAVSQQQNAVARFLFGLYFAVCNMTVKEEQTMKKMILMTANGMNLFEKDLEMLVQERLPHDWPAPDRDGAAAGFPLAGPAG